MNLNFENVTPEPESHSWTSGGLGVSRVNMKMHHVICSLKYAIKTKSVGLQFYCLPKVSQHKSFCMFWLWTESIQFTWLYTNRVFLFWLHISSEFLKKKITTIAKESPLSFTGDFALISYFIKFFYIRNTKPLSLTSCITVAHSWLLGHSKACRGKILLWLKFLRIKNTADGTSLVVQWLRICLPMQRMWVRSLVG